MTPPPPPDRLSRRSQLKLNIQLRSEQGTWLSSFLLGSWPLFTGKKRSLLVVWRLLLTERTSALTGRTPLKLLLSYFMHLLVIFRAFPWNLSILTLYSFLVRSTSGVAMTSRVLDRIVVAWSQPHWHVLTRYLAWVLIGSQCWCPDLQCTTLPTPG